MKKDKEFFRGALIGALAMFCVIAGGNALWKWASMAGFLPESLSATSEVENKLYLLEQMVLQLIPGERYERYVRFYLGLLLVLLLLQPVFQIFRLSEQLDQKVFLQEREMEEMPE